MHLFVAPVSQELGIGELSCKDTGQAAPAIVSQRTAAALRPRRPGITRVGVSPASLPLAHLGQRGRHRLPGREAAEPGGDSLGDSLLRQAHRAPSPPAPPAPGEGAGGQGPVKRLWPLDSLTRAPGHPLRLQITTRRQLQFPLLRTEWTRSPCPAPRPGVALQHRDPQSTRPAPPQPAQCTAPH